MKITKNITIKQKLFVDKANNKLALLGDSKSYLVHDSGYVSGKQVVDRGDVVKLRSKTNEHDKLSVSDELTLDVDKYFLEPAHEEFNPEHRLFIPVDVLECMLSVADTDNTRYYANGVFVATNNIAVASNALTLVEYNPNNSSREELKGVIIPKKAIKEFLAQAKPKYDVVVYINEQYNTYEIKCNGITLKGYGISGQFPRYVSAIDSYFEQQLNGVFNTNKDEIKAFHPVKLEAETQEGTIAINTKEYLKILKWVDEGVFNVKTIDRPLRMETSLPDTLILTVPLKNY